MTYSEWSQEYLRSAEMIKEKISKLKAELETAPLSMIAPINSRISILYGMYLDCNSTANILAARKGVID
ncbi:MAG: hypothetical protein ACI4GV_07135 [Acutalibacteraceae bacterium]